MRVRLTLLTILSNNIHKVISLHHIIWLIVDLTIGCSRRLLRCCSRPSLMKSSLSSCSHPMIQMLCSTQHARITYGIRSILDISRYLSLRNLPFSRAKLRSMTCRISLRAMLNMCWAGLNNQCLLYCLNKKRNHLLYIEMNPYSLLSNFLYL